MNDENNILLVDDEEHLLESLSDVLRQHGYTVECARSAEEALNQLSGNVTYDLVISDLKLPHMDGLELLNRIRNSPHPCPTIVLTGHGSIDSAVKAMRLGAEHYLLKPVNPEELFLAIDKIRGCQQVLNQNAYFMEELCQKYNIENIVGRSQVMRELLKRIKSVSSTDSTVLITGESGTGKELVACHLHYASQRNRGPFKKVSCASLSPGVVESELFGHEKGSFTGAVQSKAGYFELAHTGTLFLDEVGDIPLLYQTKLLRVLQSQEFERVGGTRSIRSDFRLISATNHDLRDNIRQGSLREDLYFRLNVVEIEIPPLRQRLDDLPPLVDHFIRIFRNKTSKRIYSASAEFLEACRGYRWSGNVRELKNVIERAFVDCQEEQIGLKHLPPHIVYPGALNVDLGKLPIRSLEDLERGMVELCLKETDGNHTQAARLLGITRSTLSSKMKRFNLT